MENKIPPYLLESENNFAGENRKVSFTFLDRTLSATAKAVRTIYLQAESANNKNIIQRINPKVKLFSLLYLIVIISIANNIASQLLASFFLFVVFAITGLKVTGIYRKIFMLAFMFGFIVVLPASLNFITHGDVIFSILDLGRPVHFWIYDIPQNIGITREGIHVVMLIFLRVFNSISLSLLIIFTTPFSEFIRSFKTIGVPDSFLMIILLTYKYIFILSKTIEEMYVALKSRLSGNIKNNNLRKLVSGRIHFIYKKSQIIYENTYYAMVSRGYSGKMTISSVSRFSGIDFISLAIVVALGITIILI